MELKLTCARLWFLLLSVSIAATLLTQCDARASKQSHPSKHVLIKNERRLEMDDYPTPTLSNIQPYVDSPFTLPPFDSLSPMPLPENTPPSCEYPPSTPQPPSTILPTPTAYMSPPPPPPPPPESSDFTPITPVENPPPSPVFTLPTPPDTSPTPNPPEFGPSPPSLVPGTPENIPTPPSLVPGTPEYIPTPPSIVPGTPEYVPSPPDYYLPPSPTQIVPGPPGYQPSPPTYFPAPSGSTPSPTIVFQPPVIYPPPSVPPPPHKGGISPHNALWCVVKPSVPDPIIEEAMNYACGSGADCGSIQQNGSCYQPDTLLAHASYAFNSYWQRTKAAGGTCDFGGTGMLVTMDPSSDECHFIYY